MDTHDAARRWAATWQSAWVAHDVEAIAALYAPDAVYRSSPYREPEEGGARGYVGRVFVDESEVVCRFGPPLVDGDRAVVEWWASMLDDGEGATLAGTTSLRFDADGLVVEHLDHWMHAPGRHDPFPGWPGGR
ncbi:MAG: nuclear transport factor 2 family protein [Candidatus Nanopelagicales bacterium]